jgi:ribA/ribD-fused uncharacterized protein
MSREEGGTPDPIRFYSKTTAQHELSNFAPLGFEQKGRLLPPVEHDVQAQKSLAAANTGFREKIRPAETPREAKVLGRTRSIAMRPDWEEMKESSMLHSPGSSRRASAASAWPPFLGSA